jgi:hypothetical protein
MDGPKRLSEGYGDEKYLFAQSGIELQIVQFITKSLYW